MSYLNALDPTVPVSTESVGQGDDRIRELKAALIERVESFFNDIDAEPWTVKLDAINAALAFSDGTFPGAKLIDGSVSLAKLAVIPTPGAGGIATSQIADDAITQPKMADNSVGTLEIIDASVSTNKIVDGAVRRAKLYPGLASDLVRWQSYTLVLGSTVLGAGIVARGSVNVDTNDQLGGAVACIIEPAFSFADASGATHVTDYILAQCSVTLNGSQEVLVYRLHNLLASTVDLTGQVYYIHMLQRLSTAPAEV